MDVAITTSDDNNLSAFERFVQSQEPAKALFIAISSYLDCPAIVSEPAFKVLVHLLNMLDYENPSMPVIVSVPTLMTTTGMAKETVQRAIKELIAKQLIAYTSGHYEKDKAYKVRKEKFQDTKRTRSYNEPNAYMLYEAIRVGLCMAWLKSLAREQGIPIKEVREIIRATSQLQDMYIKEVLGKPPTRTSMKSLREHLHELPDYLYVLFASEEIGQKLGNLPDEIGRKLGNLIGQKLANLIGQKLGNQIYQFLGKDAPPLSLPSLDLPSKSTHTHSPAEKNRFPSGTPADDQPPQKPEPQGSEKPSRPADQLPDAVREALLDHIRRQRTARSPIAVLKAMSEAEVKELAREVLSELIRYDYELQEEIDRLPDGLDVIELLEYALLSEEGRLEWLEKKGIALAKPEELSREAIEETIRELIERFDGDLEKVQEVLKGLYGRDEERFEEVRKVWKELKSAGKLYIDKEKNYVEWR